MLLLGISLSVSGRIGGSLFAAGLGLFISFIYWFGYTLILSLGYAGILPSMFSAFIMPAIFWRRCNIFVVKIPELKYRKKCNFFKKRAGDG